MKKKTRELKSLRDTQALAQEFAEKYKKIKGSRLLILLDGPMGVGKTGFCKFLLEALQNHEAVSPSFAIHNSYSTDSGDVEHIDLFRIESQADLESTGIWDLFTKEKALILIEWASRLNEFNLLSSLPDTWPRVQLNLSVSDLKVQSRRVEMVSERADLL